MALGNMRDDAGCMGASRLTRTGPLQSVIIIIISDVAMVNQQLIGMAVWFLVWFGGLFF